MLGSSHRHQLTQLKVASLNTISNIVVFSQGFPLDLFFSTRAPALALALALIQKV